VKRPPHGDSTPLAERAGALGELLRRGNAELAENTRQPEALRRLEARLSRQKEQRSWLVPAFGLGAAGALASFLLLQEPAAAPELVRTGMPERPPAAQSARPAPVEPESTFAQGSTKLPDGSAVQVAAQSQARWKRTRRGIQVELAAGEVRCDVPEQPAGQEFVITTGSYRFVVLGTELSVRNTMEESYLEVFSGSVQVQRDAETVATVSAGERWVGPNAAAREQPEAPEELPALREARRAEPAPVAPGPAPAADCTALVKSQTFAEAASCYALQAEGSGLAAELALFELSRLRLSALHDASGAVRTLEEHQQRFPRGVLTSQVQVALVRALSAAGRHEDALEALEPLIARGGQKRGELERLQSELRALAGQPGR
jgi:hypothetical protein